MQAKILFVTATGTGVGKTYATLKLLEAFHSLNIRCGALKPVETGADPIPQDADKLLQACRHYNPAYKNATLQHVCPYVFSLPAAPFCADVDQTIEIKTIIEAVTHAQTLCDLLIIEGAGGLKVPILSDFYMIDLAKMLHAFTLLVTPSRLGCINETELSLEALQRRDIPHEWCVNLYEEVDSFDRVTRPYYAHRYPHWWSLQEGLNGFAERFLS